MHQDDFPTPGWKERFPEPIKFLPVIFILGIIGGLYWIYLTCHLLPRLQESKTTTTAAWEFAAFHAVTLMLLVCYFLSVFVHPGTIPDKEEDSGGPTRTGLSKSSPHYPPKQGISDFWDESGVGATATGALLVSVPVEELSDVKSLKRRLLHQGVALYDKERLELPTDVHLVMLPFASATEEQRDELVNAVEQNRLPQIEEILQRPQDPSLTDTLGRTPLGMASDGETARLLVEAGSERNLADDIGETALISAAREGRTEVARALLEFGASTELSDDDGWTPLTVASVQGKPLRSHPVKTYKNCSKPFNKAIPRQELRRMFLTAQEILEEDRRSDDSEASFQEDWQDPGVGASVPSVPTGDLIGLDADGAGPDLSAAACRAGSSTDLPEAAPFDPVPVGSAEAPSDTAATSDAGGLLPAVSADTSAVQSLGDTTVAPDSGSLTVPAGLDDHESDDDGEIKPLPEWDQGEPSVSTVPLVQEPLDLNAMDDFTVAAPPDLTASDSAGLPDPGADNNVQPVPLPTVDAAPVPEAASSSEVPPGGAGGMDGGTGGASAVEPAQPAVPAVQPGATVAQAPPPPAPVCRLELSGSAELPYLCAVDVLSGPSGPRALVEWLLYGTFQGALRVCLRPPGVEYEQFGPLERLVLRLVVPA
ncbi:Kidins220 [Symbiodinium sp. KB8]|nr:Kidins220 [Symbiodinium sp. KB8]